MPNMHHVYLWVFHVHVDGLDVSDYLLYMHFHLSPVSGNVKTGPMPVSTSSKETCPASCKFRNNGCYAANGPLNIHWNKVTNGERGDSWEVFLGKIKKLPRNQLYRHNAAGDLVGSNDVIDFNSLVELTEANKGKRGFSYSHYPLTPENIKSLEYANDNGLTINISTNSLSEVDKAMDTGLPVVTVLPSDHETTQRTIKTEGGHTVMVCPSSLGKDITCLSCGLCQKRNRSYAIGFLAHGVSKKKVSAISKEAN